MTKKGTIGDIGTKGSDASAPRRVPTKSKDSLFGEAVVFFVFLLLSAFVGFFVYLGYRVMETREDDRISIEVLSEQPDMAGLEETITEVTGEAEPETDVEPETPKEIDKASVEVMVLNGGAPGGTAGKVVDALKKAGFSKAKAGNATGNHTGTKVYYGTGSETVAQSVRTALSATYADVAVFPADPGMKDTTSAPVTVIVAK